jgi:hypothetical protein
MEREISAFHEAQYRWNTPQALFAANFVLLLRYFDHPCSRIDTEPSRVIRPVLENPIPAVEAGGDVAGSVGKDPLGEQRARWRRDTLGCLSNFKSLFATAPAQKSEGAR